MNSEELNVADVQKDEKEPLPWFMFGKGRVNNKALADAIIAEAAGEGRKILTMRDTKEAYVYNEGKYVPDEFFVSVQTQNYLDKWSNTSIKNNVVDQVEKETLINRSAFNKGGSWINLSNEMYNIDTHEHRKPTMEDLYTYKLPIVYNPKAKCPEINKFLCRILPDEQTRLLIKEEIAYCFLPGQPFEKLMAWVGEGQNGKTTLMAIILAMFNEENMSYASLQQLSSGSSADYYQADLFGKRINMCGDMSKGSIKYFDAIKKLTSKDPISCRHAYGRKNISFINDAKLIFAMNEWPDFNDTSDAAFRRIEYTEFNETISKEERIADYHKILIGEEELSGFFNELMVVLKDMLKRGRFCKETDVEELRASMTDTESVDMFLKTNTSEVKGSFYFREDLYKDYEDWCEGKFIPMLKSPFYKYIGNNYITRTRKDPKDGKLKRAYFNIGNIKDFKMPGLKV